MKRKARQSERGVDFFFKRIGSTSSANINIGSTAENAKPSEDKQPLVDDSSNPVVMQTDEQNNVEVEPTEISEQGRIGITSYMKEIPVSVNRFGNFLLISKKKHGDSIVPRALISHR